MPERRVSIHPVCMLVQEFGLAPGATVPARINLELIAEVLRDWNRHDAGLS